MKQFSEEAMFIAKQAKSAGELFSLAKENGIELTEEEAKAYFSQIHISSGELSEDELDHVAGGGCHAGDGRLIVTVGHYCANFGCKLCGSDGIASVPGVGSEPGFVKCAGCGDIGVTCGYCRYCSYEGGLWLCNNPKNKK